MKIKVLGLFLYSFWLVSCEETTTIGPCDADACDSLEIDSDSEASSTGSALPDTTEVVVTELSRERQHSVAEARKLKELDLPILKFDYYGPHPDDKKDGPLFTTRNDQSTQENDAVLTAGEDFRRTGQFILDCVAPYPVQWRRDGLDVSPTSRSHEDDNKIRSNYNIKLVVGTPQRSIEEQDSGNYSCVGKDNPELSVAVYIYVPGRESTSPCAESPCGVNAICEERHGNRSCSCLPGFVGNPDVSCREECSLNSDCPNPLVCIGTRCVDSCIGACGQYAYCQMIEQVPICSCLPGYVGDPYDVCLRNTTVTTATPELCAYCGLNTICVSTTNNSLVCKCRKNYVGDSYKNCEEQKIESPCNPSPCGENAICEEKYGRAICHCEDNFYGDPWTKCHPECFRREHCSADQICVQMRCKDACSDTCGGGAECKVVKPHYVECTCPEGKTGDPYTECTILAEDSTEEPLTNATITNATTS